MFIQATVVRVKKDISGKMTQDARALNESNAKDKHPAPSLNILIDMIAQKLDKKKKRGLVFVRDMTYAYGRFPLHELTKMHCNFQCVGGKSTGSFRFSTGNYGLAVMTTEFHKMMDLTPDKMNGDFCEYVST